MLEYEDEDTGMRIKRLWSFRDRNTGERYYVDILEMPEADRKLPHPPVRPVLDPVARVRKAMADYFAGQRFFDFYTDSPADEEVERKKPAPRHAPARSR